MWRFFGLLDVRTPLVTVLIIDESINSEECCGTIGFKPLCYVKLGLRVEWGWDFVGRFRVLRGSL